MTVKRLRYIAQVIREQFPQASDELQAIALQLEASAEGRPKRHGNTIFHQLERQAERRIAVAPIDSPVERCGR